MTTLYSFCSQAGCADGGLPNGLIQAADGTLYGTTTLGGLFPPNGSGCFGAGCGTVFKISPGGDFTSVYSFCAQTACPDGELPYAGLVQGTDGNFYGTTSLGGANAQGTVFKITPAGTLTTLYSFCAQPNCVDGAFPRAGLAQGSDGTLYGATYTGGTNQCPTFDGPDEGCGTIFSVTPAGVFTTLHNFCSESNCADGYYTISAMIQGADGNFYGTTFQGGDPTCIAGSLHGAPYYQSCGVVFRITPSGALTTLHSFATAEGNYPRGALLQGQNGTFFGTTDSGGGSSGGGTIFSLTP